MTFLLFVVALSLSAVAAWYAIAGLVAIFAAASFPIMIMGGLLETSKLVVASWLYRNWKQIPVLMKTYFTIALVVLMLLTSMGIFGFLSKAHLDQAVPTGDVQAKLQLIDDKIKIEKENIDAARKQINQMDSITDQTISRSDDTTSINRANQIRRGQAKERTKLFEEISQSQTKIAQLNEERAPIAAEVRKVEAEVGPIKYIAAIIYEEDASTEILEKSVRFVTLLIVFVFDPLAVLLLIAANWQLKQENLQKIKDAPKEEIPSEAKNIINEFFGKKEEPKPKPPEPEPEVKKEETSSWHPDILTRGRRKLGRYLSEVTGTIEKDVDDLQK